MNRPGPRPALVQRNSKRGSLSLKQSYPRATLLGSWCQSSCQQRLTSCAIWPVPKIGTNTTSHVPTRCAGQGAGKWKSLSIFFFQSSITTHRSATDTWKCPSIFQGFWKGGRVFQLESVWGKMFRDFGVNILKKSTCFSGFLKKLFSDTVKKISYPKREKNRETGTQKFRNWSKKTSKVLSKCRSMLENKALTTKASIAGFIF